jgi:methylenetetrahydrofolate dehydrogenase (NADP+) / methenyltetrahydrofolate cyclohydrolase
MKPADAFPGASSALIIDGRAASKAIIARVGEAARALLARSIKPGLAVVLVGEDPASQVYVRNKAQQTREAGMRSIEHRLSAATAEAELLALVGTLNRDPEIDGILVQLPLPKHIDSGRIIEAIDPAKDVDGLTPVSAGRLVAGKPGLVPCTPLGCVMLLERALGTLAGRDAVIVGRSILVGKPLASLLLAKDCTVTTAHSKTRDLAGVTRRAEILVAAIGRPEFVGAEFVRPGATVIDVGINRVATAEGKSRLVGDVDFAAVTEIAGAITPVPGGVGPMTIACLLYNTLAAARARRGW